MKKQILLALFFSFTYLGLNAQCNIPFAPSLTCASAPVICDLDGYCTTSGGANSSDQPSTFCGSVQNNQWFAFVAGSANITLDFIVGLCGGTTSGTGLQAQVYSVCGSPWTSASNCLYEISPNSTGTLTMTGLTVGNVYYLMTDGFSGDICDYTIEVTSGSTTPPTPDPAGPINGDAQFCPGASSVTYCADPSFGAAFYQWTIPPGATIVGADDGECITIDFGGIIGTTGVITATPTNGCESGAPSSFNVSQGPAPTTPDVDFILCPGDTEIYGNTVYSTAGTFLNTDIANAQGCLIETYVNVTVGQDVTTDLVEVICSGETSTTGESSTGIYTYNLFTYLGCDSTVTLDLTVLNPQTGIFPVTDEIDCSGDPIQVNAVVTDTDPSIMYIWSGPCFVQNFPQDPNISVSCGGVYEVFAQQTVGGVTCVSPTFSVTVTENTTPPTADPGLGGVIDCGNTSVTLGGSGSSNTSTYAFSWTGPNGYSSSQQFPVVTETGNYCFFMIDQATQCISSTECVTITGDNTLPVAVASASNNLDCDDITATLDPTGSDPGTYTWTGPGNPTGANPTVNMPGTYTLTVLSPNGCSSTQEVTITQDNAAPTANIATPAAIDCDNPTVTLDGSGSSGGVTYLWSTGETTATATTNAGAGTYTLTVTNISNGCTDEVSVVVDDNSTVVTADIDVAGQITCTNGSVTLSGINVTGSANPTYSWSNGMSGQTITVNTDGSITLTVTDAVTGCSGDVTAMVTSDTTDPTAVAGVSGELNCDNTSVVLSTAGSSTGPNITASWSATDPNNVTTPGTYTLTITNTDNGCTATDQIIVNQDIDAPNAAIATPTAIDCNNTSIVLDGSSSTGANLSYVWAPGGTTGPTLNAAAAGTYTLTVLNQDNGCTDTEEVTVIDNTTTVSVTASVSNDLSCTETSATLDVSGGSGSSNPTYSWFDGTTTTAGPTLTTMIPGTYTLTLIDGTTGCQGSTEVTVLQDTNFPTAEVATPNNLNCTTSSVTLDGTASTTGNNITYSWLFNGAVIPSQTDPIISVTNPGDYQIVVTDVDNGCEVTSSLVPVILDNTPPVASAVAGNNGVLSCSATSLTIDGSASSTNSGNIEYSWVLNGTIVGSGSTYDVTTPGDYILEITDIDNGCTAQEMVTISPDADLPILTIDPVVNLDCNNSSSTLVGNGSSNAGNTVTVEWQDASGATVSTTDQFTTTVPGDYTFIVLDDGNGCSLSQLVTVFEDTDSPLIDVTPAPIIDCANTSIIVNASGSATGTNIIYQWQDDMGNDLPSETSNTLTTSTPGDYIFVVTNTDNGCTSTQMVNVPVNIEAPVFDASALNNIDCNNAEASLTSSITSSFSTDLSYNWVLNGVTIGTTPTLSTANEGTVTVTVTDLQNGCSTDIDVIVSNTTAEPTALTTASNNGALDCITTETIIDGTGSSTGTNFSYSWELNNVTIPGATDIMYTTEDPGVYTLIVTNNDNGCTNTISATITQSIAEPTAVVTSNTATLTCNEPTITLDGTSSSIGASFTYQWYEVVGGTSTAITDATDISLDVDVEGTYELVVTNTDNGCTEVSNQMVLIQSTDVPTAVISNDGILTCDNGDVLLDGLSSTAGGTLTYQWMDSLGNVIQPSGAELTVTTPGEITLLITDTNNGCTSTDVFLVEENIDAPVALAGTGGTLLCNQTSIPLDGSASSQNGNFTYEWWTFVNGATQDIVEPSSINYNATSPGDYVIIVTNTDNGCTTISAPVTVGQNTSEPIPAMTPSALVLNCDVQTITFDAGGSTVGMQSSGSLIYEWTDANGATIGNTETINVSTTDEVTLTITDDTNGCSTSANYSTTQDIEEPSANAGPIQTLTCESPEVMLDGSSSSANGDPITYEWYAPNDPANIVATTATTDVSIAGTWTLVITNTDNGCTSASTVLVDENIAAPTAVVDFSGMLTCVDTELTIDGSNSTIQSPNGAIEYLWENGATTPTTTFDTPGTYTVLITDNGNGCTAQQSFTIEQDETPPIADIQAITSTTISCDEPSLVFNGSGSNNGGNPNGGTLTYEWTLNNMPVTGGTSDQVEISQPGDLQLLVTNTNNGCTSIFTVNVDVSDDVPNVTVPTAPQLLSCIVDESTINAVDNSIDPANNTYMWTGPGTIANETTLNPTVSATGLYTLQVVNTVSGCDISITALVEGDFEEPNAFATATDQFDCVTDEVTLDGNGSATGPTISYLWTTATGVIESGQTTINPVVSAPGDYTLLVTDNGNGCTSTTVVTVSANNDVPVIQGVQVIEPNCFGENNGSITLDNVTGGDLPYLYSIDGGALAPINQFSFLPAGQYDVLVQDANGCEASQLVTITDPQELLVELGDDQTIGLGDEFQLSAQIVGAYDTIMWSANCPDSICADQPEFSISPLNTISYFVTVVDGNGCITTDQITINVEKGREVFIPNAFTPNGDGNNDRFWIYPGGEVAKVHEFRVFNRWGEQVFGATNFDPFTQDDSNGWDGTLDNKKMNPAVFVYYVDIEYIDGRREVLKGDVALRR